MEQCKLPQLKAILNFLKLPSSGTKVELKRRIDEELVELQLSFDELLTQMEEPIDNHVTYVPENVPEASNLNHGIIENADIVLESQPEDNFNHNSDAERVEDPVSVTRRKVRSRSRSVMSAASGGSITSSASAMERRREAAVKFAKMEASKGKRREMMRKEAEKNLLQAEIEDAEIEAEEQVWRNLEKENMPEVPRMKEIVSEDSQYIVQHSLRTETDEDQDRMSASRIVQTVNSSDEPDLREVLLSSAARREVRDGSLIDENILPVSRTNDVLRELVKCNDRSMLPKRNIEIFRGMVERFLLFKTAFESAVGSFELDKREKLHYLYQYTEGTPRDLVESCLYMKESEGYDRAWVLLNKRYGSSEQIGAAHIQKVLAFPEISRDDPQALDQFAIVLVMTDNAVSQLKYGLTELENPQTIRQIVAKLPYSLQDRWRRIATDILEKELRSIRFKDVLRFIEGEATVANNPVYGKLAMKTSISKGSNSKRAVIGTIKEILNCLNCGEKHEIQECHAFETLAHDEKINVLRRNDRCFLCLNIGHMARQCDKHIRCNVCNGWHNTILHINGYEPSRAMLYERPKQKSSSNYDRLRGIGRSKENPESYTGGTKTTRETDGSHEESDGNVRMTVMSSSGSGPYSGRMCVVPVIIEDKNGMFTETFALLDNGSAVTLCSKSLLTRLGVHKRIVRTANLTFVTLGGECVVDGAFVEGLVLRGAHNSDDGDIPLPPVYVVNKIPIDSCDAASKQEIYQWNHLRRIDVTEVGDVEMIIGANAPLATEPLEVISAPIKGQPYAIRTRLGWIACGITGGMKKDVKIGKISIKDVVLNEVANRTFDDGLNEIGSEKCGLSGEDEKSMQIVENGCRKVKEEYEMPSSIPSQLENLPSNRVNQCKSFLSFRKKLKNNSKLRNRYVVTKVKRIDKFMRRKYQKRDYQEQRIMIEKKIVARSTTIQRGTICMHSIRRRQAIQERGAFFRKKRLHFDWWRDFDDGGFFSNCRYSRRRIYDEHVVQNNSFGEGLFRPLGRQN